MRKLGFGVALVAIAATAACSGNKGGVFANRAPDEFQVARRAPLVIPPDFALNPPKPGAPRPQEADSSTQALQALFGGPAPRSAEEEALEKQAGRAPESGIRSDAGSPDTDVVDKGGVTKDILAAPTGTTGNEATAATPK